MWGDWIGAMAMQRVTEAGWEFDPGTLRPFTDGVPYLGSYETGLYPGGTNEIPEAHRKAGERIAATIRPLDAEGGPDDGEGRVLALVMGHSNCRMYFEALQSDLGAHAAELNPRFEMLNAAVGGQQLPQIVALQGKVWQRAEELTCEAGRSPRQVQVLFLHTTYHGWRNVDGAPPGPFPETMQQMQRDLVTVLAHCVQLYPNLRLAYLTCDGFRHFTGFEPHVYQEAFAMKWLVAAQMQGTPGTAYAGDARSLPWLQWGPYFWDNTWDAGYFTDGVHPAPAALDLFVAKYWQHLTQDPVARPWLFRGTVS